MNLGGDGWHECICSSLSGAELSGEKRRDGIKNETKKESRKEREGPSSKCGSVVWIRMGPSYGARSWER